MPDTEVETETFLIVTREYTVGFSPEEIEWMEDDGVALDDEDAVYRWAKDSGAIEESDYIEDHWLHVQKIK